MSTLHNQTKSPLAWTMGGRKYTCEPWGSVEVPEKLVPICKQYTLPLGLVPVAPELRAKQRVEDEQDASKNDVLRALKGAADTAKAQAEAAAKELEKCQLDLQEARTEVRELKAELKKTVRAMESALADKKASDDLLAEAARNATDAEERALKAEARLVEQNKKPAKK